MKNETQDPKNIKDVYAGNNQLKINTKTNRMKSSIASACEVRKGEAIGRTDKPNIFLAQNKGKGPPGRQRSPVGFTADRVQNPARGKAERQQHRPVRCPANVHSNSTFNALPSKYKTDNSDERFFEKLINNDNEIYTNTCKNNFSQSLNFTNMKKQIFTLILAVFASVTVAFGQATHSSNPLPLSCTDDALHPIAGKPYPYSVAATPSGGQYTWWATKDATFIQTTATGTTTNNLAGRLISPDLTQFSPNYGVADPASSVTITWSSSILAGTSYQGTVAGKSPTFVAVYYTPPAGSGCADNFKVFELDPKNGFTVDIMPLDPTTKAPLAGGYTATATQCFANVSYAHYTPGKMEYLYGVNTLYYEVVAANFSDQWFPQFTLSGLQGDQTAVIEWDYTTAFASPKAVTTGVLSAQAATTSATDTSNGVSIYVRVTITNNHFEGLADESITLAADGTNKEGLWDVRNDDCALPNPNAADQYDKAYQTLQKRPTVVEGTTSTIPTNVGIIPKNP